MPSLTFDISSIAAQLTALLQECMKSVLDSGSELTRKAKDSDIEGLREQITANATILLPALRPDAAELVTFAGQRQTAFPKLHIITSGQPDGDNPSVRAYVLYGQYDTRKMVKFLYTEQPTETEAAALTKLLGVSSQLIERTFVDDGGAFVEGRAIAVPGGGWCAVASKHLPEITPPDITYWDKENTAAQPGTPESTPNTSPTVSFCSDSSDSSTGSMYPSTTAGSMRGFPNMIIKDSHDNDRRGAGVNASFGGFGSDKPYNFGPKVNASFGGVNTGYPRTVRA